MAEEIAVVTGAASGIGASVARRLAERGAHVALLDRDERGLRGTRESIAASGGASSVHTLDVTDDDGMATAIRFIRDMWGRITTVVACAGIETMGDVTTVDPADWKRTLDVNVTGTYLTARHTIPVLIDSGGGTFTVIASDAGVWGAQGYAAYCASKHAVIGLVKCMALDHGPQGIRCNAICPGFVETPMADRIFAGASQGEREFFMSTVPLGRFARPDEVAAAVAHLSSTEASYANGLVYRLDGGSTAGYYRP